MFDFLFGKTGDQINKEYDKALKNAGEERANAVFDAVYNNRLYNANKDKFDAMGVEKPAYASEVSSAYQDSMNELQKEADTARRQNKYNVFGNGLIGSVLNPVAQVGSIAGDMLASPIRAMSDKETNRYKMDKDNDFVSDIGAMGEVGFDALGWGSLGDAIKGGTKLMSNVGKTALRQGALGAGENAFSALREKGGDASLGDFVGNMALGGALGAGIGAVGQIGGNAANIAKTVRSPQMKTLNSYYQDALAGNAKPLNPTRMLGDGAGGATIGTKGNYLDWVPNSAKTAMERSNTPLAKTGLGRVVQGIKDSNAIYGSPFSGIANSKLGQTTKNILSTKAGKVGAGVGGGLLLAKLLYGNNKQELSDAEIEQILNNYNGGY